MPYPIKTLSELPLLLLGLRKSQKVTQADMARQLGISQQSYAKLEANPSVASMARLFRVLQLLGAEFIIDTTSPANRAVYVQHIPPAFQRTARNIAAQELAPYIATRIQPEDPPPGSMRAAPNQSTGEVTQQNHKSDDLSDQLTRDAIAHFKKDPW